ncbi:MAG: S41 family peptidase [Chloroflexi bacterium]|nr:S41 family peptidase [Chloroflexota bacterium]
MGLPQWGAPSAHAQLIQSEFNVLAQDYVLPLDPAVLGLATSSGLYDAVRAQLGEAAAAHFPYVSYQGTAVNVRIEIARQYELAREQYPQVNGRNLAYTAMQRMAQSVGDCHTNFFTPQEFQEQQAELQGKVQFGGIGATLQDRPGATPLIGEVFPGLPAAKAGLHRGDAIVRVDGKSVKGLTAAQVVKLIRGPVGTVVQLDVEREGAGLLHFSITRASVTPPPLIAQVLTANGQQIGYVHIFSFSPEMPGDLQQALSDFEGRNITEWIIDLRDNGGGTVQALEQAASLLLPPGPIAILQNRNGQERRLDTTGAPLPAPSRLVVLVNGSTASASEIMAAALRERGRAEIVGSQTAGCVAVGDLHPLADGSAIEYAADRVYTPVRGQLLNGVGVHPDVVVNTTVNDLAANRDPQLNAAVQVVEGRTVVEQQAQTSKAISQASISKPLLQLGQLGS